MEELTSHRIFEVAIIVFSLFQQGNNNAIAKSGAPNHTVSNTISDIAFFIPGVTASLVVFLVFGTTKSWRQYRDLVVGGCGVRRRIYERRIRISEEGDNSGGLEFERLPSLPNRKSEDNAINAERRVRLFVTSMPKEPEAQGALPPIITEPESLSNTRAPITARNVDFYNPRFVGTSASVPLSKTNGPRLTSAVVPAGLPVKENEEDAMVQYGPVDEERGHGGDEGTGGSRFVSEQLPKNES